MLSRYLMIAALALGTLPLLAGTPCADAQSARPDIIVIPLDDMRADDWPMLADTRRLVGGTFFENFVFNTPLCCPFRASFQTGMLAHNTGIKENGDGSSFTRLDNDTLATALRDAGYHTAYVGKYMNDYRKRAPGWDDWRAIPMPKSEKRDRYRRSGTYVTTLLGEWASAAIDRAPADQPLFLMVGHVAPHFPWTPEGRYKDADVGPVRNADDAKRKRTLLSVDDATETMAAALGNRWDDAVVLVVSDNGFLLDEHGTEGKSHWWAEASAVPILLRAPGIGGGRSDRMVSTVDLPATLLAAANASMRRPLDGRPLQENWDRESVLIESWSRSSFGHKRVPFRALRGDGWVYVEAKDTKPRYYKTSDRERSNQIKTLDAAERKALAKRLAELRDCRGAECG